MFNITINGKLYQIEEGLSIIDACDILGVKIPRFCYLKGLSIPANCRMCLVEVKGARKLVPACHTLITNNMEIFTNSEVVGQARKKIMAFLLINHPLDCPICDEAGECELQNQAVAYGYNESHYEFSKRSRENINLGPLIVTSMNKCINCTRCVRFMSEVAGNISLDMIGRGENSNISNYFQDPIDSELSGNLVDVCPVGALNNAQYLFRERPWQLNSYKTIDILETVCSEIIVNKEGEEVVRILPIDYAKINKAWSLNKEISLSVTELQTNTNAWISDKTRYICDAIDKQRIDTPWIRVNGQLQKATFEEAFHLMKNNLINLTGNEIAALAGRFADVESMLLLKELMLSLDSALIDCRLNNIAFTSQDRNSYIFNTTIENIGETDCILIIGSNPKKEVPVLNYYIRKRVVEAHIPVGVIGEDIELNYDNTWLGDNLTLISDLLSEKNSFSKILSLAKKPMIIVGQGAFINQDYNKVQNLLYSLCNKFNIVNNVWNGYNFIHTSIGNIGGIDIGFTNTKFNVTDILNKASSREVKFMWLLNADEINEDKLNNSFVVYIGHHGNKVAQQSNVVLPAALWLEKNSTYVNIEGKALETIKIKPTLKEAKEDWKIIKLFSDYINKPLPYISLLDIRVKMAQINSVFNNYNFITKNSINKIKSVEIIQDIFINKLPISSVVKDFYLTDVISKNSSTMAKCSQLFHNLKFKSGCRTKIPN